MKKNLFPVFSLIALLCACDPPIEEGIDCTLIAEVSYGWGGSSNECGPEYNITLAVDGTVSITGSVQDESDTGAGCVLTDETSTISEEDANATVLAVCDDFNDGFENGADDCVGSWSGFGVVDASGSTLETAGGGCGPSGLETAADLMRALWDEVAAAE